MFQLTKIILILQFILKYTSALKIQTIEKLHKTGYIDGRYIIGALFPVHGLPHSTNYKDPLECDKIRGDEGIQLVEAAFYAVDAINRDETILPGTKLGITIKDECWNELVALYQTIKLIEVPASVRRNASFAERTCSKANTSALIGVIGTASTTSTNQVQNLLKLFKIPQIGYSAPSLDRRSPYFYLSVVPNNYHEAYLIINLLRKFNWTYISIAYTGDYLGINGKFFVEEWVSHFDICIAASVHIPQPHREKMYANAITELFKDRRAKVIICFCYGPTITNLYREIRKQNLTGNYMIIGSNDWPTNYATVEGFEEQAHGSIMVGVKRKNVPEFDHYFLNRSLGNNKRNPWFEELWQHQFQCKMKPDNVNSTICTGNEDLKTFYTQGPKISYVIKSVYTLAQGLHDMRAELCKNDDNCPYLNPFNSTAYMQYLKNLNLSFNSDEYVNFAFNGSPMVSNYDIYNFKKLQNGSFQYVKVSEYRCDFSKSDDENSYSRYFKYFDNVQFPAGKSSFTSSCSDPCKPGQIQQNYSFYLEQFGKESGHVEKICCWNCMDCEPSERVFNESSCQPCALGLWPNANKTDCIALPFEYVEWTTWQVYTAKGASIVGIMFTLFTMYVFLKYRDTPVVKSSTRELCYIILIGLLLHHSTIFIAVAEPSIISCAIIRTIPSISTAMIYAALLVKTNRIARLLAISKKKFPNLNPRFMTLKAQIVLTSVLTSIQVFLCTFSIIVWPSSVLQIHQRNSITSTTFVQCFLSEEMGIICSIYNLLLILLCTYYAFKSRNIPDNFNEAKFIGFLMYIICLLYTVCTLVYYGNKHMNANIIETIFCTQMLGFGIAMTVNGFSTLFLLFLPKLYIILWAPHKNTRQHFATATGIRCIIGRKDIIDNEQLLKKKFMKNDLKNLEELLPCKFLHCGQNLKSQEIR